MPFGGALIAAGAISAGGSIISSLFGSSAASKAAKLQADSERQALDFQKGVYSDQKANQAPFVQAGQSSIGQLMDGFQNGTFGPGSIPAFTAPTLEDARNTPGYQFTQQQGEQGIERGYAAAGGAFNGGTLKALAGFDTGLADSTYNDVFARAMSAYNAHLQGQNQAFNQLSATASLGENAAANVGNNGAQASTTIGTTLGNIGNSQSAGIVGSANAITGGIAGATSAATSPFYLNYLRQSQPLGPPQQLPAFSTADSLANAQNPALQGGG